MSAPGGSSARAPGSSLAWLGAACVARRRMRRGGAVARAGRSRARCVKLPADEAAKASEPLWELGVGVAGFRFDDYRGSDQSNTYLLPLPFFVYRGPLPARRPRRRARDPVRRPAGSTSTSASARRCRPRARTTRRAAACPTWPAPSRSARTSTSSSGRRATGTLKVDLRLPRARGDHARALAARDRPDLLAQPEPRHQRPARQREPRLARRAAVRATSATTSTSTASPRSSRPRAGPPTRRPGGYAGWRATTAFSRRFGNAWLGAFVRYDNLHGAVFAPSPLVRKRNHTSLRASASHGSSRLRASAY